MAVADLTAAYAALCLGLTGAERREVIVEEETLVALLQYVVDHLLVHLRAEGAGRERHGFATLEERTSVGHRQRVYLAPDRTYLVCCTAVHALAGVEDTAAHGVALHVCKVTVDFCVFFFEVVF